MAEAEWKVLVVGGARELESPENRAFFDREFDVNLTRAVEREDFDVAIEGGPYDVVVIDATIGGADIVRRIRSEWPAVPVLMVADLEQAESLLDAKEAGLDAYLIRHPDPKLNRELVADQLRFALEGYSPPDEIVSPSALALHRYAQYYNVVHPFLVVDPTGIIRYYNAAAREFCQDIGDLELVIGNDVGPLRKLLDDFDMHLEDALAGRQAIATQSFPRAGDQPPLREVFYQPVRTRSGRVIAVSIAIYVATNPEVEKERRLQTIGRLAAGVAHDFNNLLGVVATCTELIRRRVPEDADQGDWDFVIDNLDKISTAVDRGADLTAGLLSYTRQDSVQRELVDVSEVLAESRSIIEQLLSDDIEVVFELEPELPKIEADSQQLEQILMNLAANARDAMPTGGRFEVRTTDIDVKPQENPPVKGVPHGRLVEMVVSDTGAGMTDETQEHIFEPFYTTKDDEAETGLGLATVRAIVERFGGRIIVDSELGSGTTFRIYFPAIANSVDTDPQE